MRGLPECSPVAWSVHKRTGAAMSGVKFLYIHANDLAAMRGFYTDRIGLEEIYFQTGQALGYNSDGFQFTVLAASGVAQPDGWATQPGWQGATSPLISWSVELSEVEFKRAVESTAQAGDASLHVVPQWVGYWSHPVRDPMGNTVELSWPADASGQTGEWPTPSR